MNVINKEKLPEYRVDPDILPCPRCGGEVEWTNSRDLELLSSYMRCFNCDLGTFNVDTCAFVSLPDLDYETTLMKYNAWCKTNPTKYFDESWELLLNNSDHLREHIC